MQYHWDFSYTDRNTTVHVGAEAPTKEEAKDKIREKHRINGKTILNFRGKRVICDTWDELKDWAFENKVTPHEAQGAIQCMVINSREPIEFLCPFCKYNMVDGPDRNGNAYSCPKCKKIVQVG